MFLGALSAPFLGELSDHIPRLRLAVLGCAVFAAATVGIGVWPTFAAYIVIRSAFQKIAGEPVTSPFRRDWQADRASLQSPGRHRLVEKHLQSLPPRFRSFGQIDP